MIENSRTMKIKSIIFILNIEKKESFYNSYNNVYIVLYVMMQTILKNNIYTLRKNFFNQIRNNRGYYIP